jgi:hypothetical protein
VAKNDPTLMYTDPITVLQHLDVFNPWPPNPENSQAQHPSAHVDNADRAGLPQEIPIQTGLEHNQAQQGQGDNDGGLPASPSQPHSGNDHASEQAPNATLPEASLAAGPENDQARQGPQSISLVSPVPPDIENSQALQPRDPTDSAKQEDVILNPWSLKPGVQYR